jgi:hypothetical protein
VSEEKPVEPFSDLHVEDDHVRATLLHDPTIEALDMALYLDGSGSMNDEYEYKKKGGFLAWLLQKKDRNELVNQVEPQAQWMLEYLATKDRDGLLRVAYWACGVGGRGVEEIGELSGVNVKQYEFPGPKDAGNGTNLVPAMQDYVRYIKTKVKTGAKQGCAVFITDGQLHDADEVKALSKKIAQDITKGALPRLNFILVGVGNDIDEEQLEGIAHEEYPGIGHLWCHRVAAEITQVAELVAVLVDETMTVAAGGTVYDDKGKVLKIYEARLPAVLEFDVPEGTKSFTLEVGGKRFTQPLPKEDHH